MLTPSDLQCNLAELSLKLRKSVKLDHLFALTDHNAVLQHANFSVPYKREGYTVDDNARALVFATKAQSIWPSVDLTAFQRKLLSFLLLMQSDEGKFHNLMDFSHRINDEPSIGDHLGRAIWSAGAVINSALPMGVKNSARRIFDRALPWGMTSKSLRTQAYTCLGLAERHKADTADRNLGTNLKRVASVLLEQFASNKIQGWNWFEGILTYDNARLSQAMLVAYEALGEEAFLGAGEESLQFLVSATTKDDAYVPIGNDGWYVKGGRAALYDQQPVEAGTMVEATAIAYKLTGHAIYEKALRQALGWFFGKNTKSVTVYDGATGACHDGITPAGLNENQGSESTVSFLLSAATIIESFGKVA
jgi:hypothetical protein